MAQSWHRFLNHRRLQVIVGYVRALEITRSNCGEAHPHYHALLLVPSTYFSQVLEVRDWAGLWRRAARLDYQPVVYVRAVKRFSARDWIDALLEVVKYCIKPKLQKHILASVD